MRKKIVTALFVCLATVACVCGLAACKDQKEHSHSFTTTVVDPTCGREGYTLYECSCGWNYKGDEVPATGEHDYGAYIDDENATCIADGTETARCQICGVYTSQIKEGSATGITHL